MQVQISNQKPEEMYRVKVYNETVVQQEINGVRSWWPDHGRPCASGFGLYPTSSGELLKGFKPLSKVTIFVF